MSAAVLAGSPSIGLLPSSGHDPAETETGSCVACGHPEEVHQLVLNPTLSFVICHEVTDMGECYRVRHSQGIAFGACRRNPAGPNGQFRRGAP